MFPCETICAKNHVCKRIHIFSPVSPCPIFFTFIPVSPCLWQCSSYKYQGFNAPMLVIETNEND